MYAEFVYEFSEFSLIFVEKYRFALKLIFIKFFGRPNQEILISDLPLKSSNVQFCQLEPRCKRLSNLEPQSFSVVSQAQTFLVELYSF